MLFGRNEAVGGEYILAYATEPTAADRSHRRDPERILLWHANYHPDGGQLFFPLDRAPFLVPLALPGDDVKPQDFVCCKPHASPVDHTCHHLMQLFRREKGDASDSTAAWFSADESKQIMTRLRKFPLPGEEPVFQSYHARSSRAAVLAHRDWLAANETRHRMRLAWAEFFTTYDLLLSTCFDGVATP